MKTKTQIFAGVLYIALMLLIHGCRAAETTTEVPNLNTIRVGHLATMGSAPFYIALDKGYFKEVGLDVELERFDSGSKMIAPLSVGQLDVGTGEPGTALFNAVSQGLDVKAVCGMAVTNKEGYASIPFVVRKDLVDAGEITQPADLKGRKIASNVLRGMTEYSIVQILETGGLTIDDVQLVPMPFPDTVASLANQAVDAAYLPHPFSDVTVNEGIAIEMFGDNTEIGEYQNGVMYFGQRFLDPANKEIAVRFLSVYLKAIRELLDSDYQNDENLAIIKKYTNLDPDVVKNTILTFQDPNCTLLPDSLEKTQAYYITRGYTDFQEAIPIEDVIDESFREAAVNQLGEYIK